MKILNKFTLRNLLKNKTRTIVTIIGTFLAVSLLFVVGIIFSSIRDNRLQSVINYNVDHHVIINNEKGYDSLKEKLQNNSKVNHFIIIENVENIYDEKNDEEYFIKSASFDYADNFVLTDGKLPANNNEIIIEFDFAKWQNVKIGDTFSGDEVIYTVVGIYNESKFDHYMHNSSYNSYSGIFYTKSEVKNDGKYYIYFNNMKNTYEETYKIAEEIGLPHLQGILASSDNKYEDVYINTPYLMLFGIGNDTFVKTIRTWIVIILGVLALFSSLAIYNAFAISVSERKKIFGIFRSLGSSKKNIFLSVIYEAFIISIIAIPLGVIFSFILAFIASKIITNYIPNADFRVVIYPSYALVSLFFSIIMIFLSALIPAFKSSSVSPLEVIRLNNDIELKKKKYKKNKRFLNIFGEEAVLAQNNIVRNKKKYRSAKISLIISIILFMVIGEFINITFGELEKYKPDEYPISVYVEDTFKGKKIVKEILSYQEVDKYLVTRLSYGDIPYEVDYFEDEYIKSREIFSLNYDDIWISSYDQKNYSDLKKKYNVDDDVIFVPKNYYERNESGDIEKKIPMWKDEIKEINVYDVERIENPNFTSNGDHYIYKYDLNNPIYTLDNLYFIDDNSLMGMIVMSEEEFDAYRKSTSNYINYPSDYFVKIDSKKYKVLDNKIKELENNNIEVSNYTNTLIEYEEYYKMIFGIKTGIYAFLGFIVLIAVTNVINTINTSIDLRKRDFSVLKSVGLSNKSFNRMLFYEGLVLGFDSLFLGQVFANVLIFIVMFTLSSNDDVVAYPYKYLIASIIGVFAIVFISIYFASRKLKKSNIIETIRNDNI